MELINLQTSDGILLEAAFHQSQSPASIGILVLAHGISVNMDEGGMFVSLAEKCTSNGFDVVRFSFRGHGKSGGTQKEVTIAGEMLDLQTVIQYSKSKSDKPLSIIAASFGAVSTCLSLPTIERQLKSLVLWNPVLDLQDTFIHPSLPWGKKNFNKQNIERLVTDGFFLIDDEFMVGPELYREWERLKPYEYFYASKIPSIIVHGNKDSYVSYAVSKNACKKRRNCELFTIKNSDHGFDQKEHADQAITITVNWLNKTYKKPSAGFFSNLFRR